MSTSFKRWMSRRKEVKMLIKVALFLVLCTICSAEDLPAFVKKCKYGDVECIVKSANDIVANHHHEVDKLKFKYFDPWQHGEITAGEEENRPIRLNMHLTNSQLYGLKGLVFNRAVGWEKDIKGRTFEIYGHNNYLNFTGNYDVDGRILLLPIQGKGDYNMLLEDITFGLRLKVDEIDKNGKKHLKIKKVKLLLDPSKFHMSLTNLFGGNEELGKSLIDVINNNWRDAWDEVAPSLFEINENIIKEVLNDFFDGFAYQDLFLPEK